MRWNVFEHVSDYALSCRNINIFASKGHEQPLQLQLLTSTLQHESMGGLLEQGGKPGRREASVKSSNLPEHHYADTREPVEDLDADQSRLQQPSKKIRRGHTQGQSLH